MVKTATPSPVQQAAHMCFALYSSPLQKSLISEPALAALHDILGSPVSADEIMQFSTKLRQDEQHSSRHKTLMGQWARRMNASQMLSEEDALAFILEIFSTLDHAVIYDHGITANSTLIERDYVSNSKMRFPGNMPCWTLHLTVAGQALFLNERMEAQVGPGEMMLFHPDAHYHYGLHPAADKWEHLWALFQPRPHWSEWLEWDALENGIGHLTLPDAHSRALLEGLFRQLVALKDDASPCQSDLQHNRLEEILIRARQYSTHSQRSPVDIRVRNACDFMRAHLATGFSIDDIAASCNLSASRFAHLFKQHMGVSPKSWGNNMRLQQARKLLLGDSASIGGIARQVGYDDPSQFTKYFKKSMGCTPRQFRQSLRGD